MTSFIALKSSMTHVPVLAFLAFNKLFIIEMDAYNSETGAVLIQEDYPVAFYSRKIQGRWLPASTYSKELWAITQVIAKWRHYLLFRKFIVHIDHCSLKILSSRSQSNKKSYISYVGLIST